MKKLELLAAIVLLPRLALLALDVGLKGLHATRSFEHWFYYGASQGLFPLGSLDPTLLLLRPLGLALSGDSLIVALKLLAILLSTVTALAVYLLAKRLMEERQAFLAAVFYSSIVEVLIISQGFTHDLVVLPLLLGSLLLLLDSKPVGWLVLLVAACANQLFVIVPLVLFGRKLAEKKGVAALAVAAIVFHLALVWGFPLFSQVSLQARDVDMLAQRAALAVDFLPVEPLFYLENYHLLLPLAMLGAASALRRREWVSLSMVLFGISAATFVGRGLVLLNVGVALLAAFGLPKTAERLWPAVVAACFLIVLLSPSPDVSSFGVSEADYLAFASLRGESGTVLTRWDAGYAAEAISGLSAVSRPDNIDLEAENTLLLAPPLAKERLAGVNFIALKEGQFPAIPEGSLADLLYKDTPPQGFTEIYGKANNTVRIFRTG